MNSDCKVVLGWSTEEGGQHGEGLWKQGSKGRNDRNIGMQQEPSNGLGTLEAECYDLLHLLAQ